MQPQVLPATQMPRAYEMYGREPFLELRNAISTDVVLKQDKLRN